MVRSNESFEKATITRSIVEAEHDRAQVVGRAEQRQLLEPGRCSFGWSSTKPTRLHAVFGMPEDLGRDQLADVACADDHGVLEVDGAAPADRARRGAGNRHEGDREQPRR